VSEFKKPERYLGAYTPNKYKSDQPPYINVMQVGSMVRVTARDFLPTIPKAARSAIDAAIAKATS